MALKLVIFDLDGTLADTLPDITDSLNFALQSEGLKPLSPERVRGIVGEGVTALVTKALGEENLQYKDSVLQKFIEHYSKHPVDNTRLYPGVEQILSRLEGFKKAIVSNKMFTLTDEVLKKLGIARYFNAIVGPETVKEKKPSPVPVEHVLRELRVEAGEAIIVGDSIFDIEAGRNAGLRASIAVTYGYGDIDSLSTADFLIDKPEDLFRIITEDIPQMARRTEKRYPIPSAGQEYVRLLVKSNGDYNRLPASILDFSRHGIRFESKVPFRSGERVTFRLSAPRSISREVEFTFDVIHAEEVSSRYIVGGRISEVSSELWFRVLKNVYDFIEKRKGEIF